MSATQQQLDELLTTLGSVGGTLLPKVVALLLRELSPSWLRQKLKALALTAFDEHVTVPGPDALVKARIRPYLIQSLDKLLGEVISDVTVVADCAGVGGGGHLMADAEPRGEGEEIPPPNAQSALC